MLINDSLIIETIDDIIDNLLKNSFIINEVYPKILYKDKLACLSWHKEADINKEKYAISFHKNSMCFISIRIIDNIDRNNSL